MGDNLACHIAYEPELGLLVASGIVADSRRHDCCLAHVTYTDILVVPSLICS